MAVWTKTLRSGVLLVLLYLWPLLFCHGQNFESSLPSALKSKLDSIPSDTGKIQLLLNESDLLISKEPSKAITYSLYALSKARKIDSQDQIDQALLKSGKILTWSAAYDKAMDFYNEYYSRALKSGNRINKLKARHNIAALRMSVLGKYDESLFQEMSSLSKSYEQIWEQERDSSLLTTYIPGILINLSLLAQLKDSLYQAERFLQKISRLAEKTTLAPLIQLQHPMALLTLYIKMERYEDALEIEAQTRAFCLQTGNKLMDATLDYYKGNIYLDMNNPQEAIIEYKNCLAKATVLENLSLASVSTAKLAQIYEQQGDLALSLKYNKESEKAKAAMENLSAVTKANQSEMLEQVVQMEREMQTFHRESTFRQAALVVLLLFLILAGGFVIVTARKKYLKSEIEKNVLDRESKQTFQELEAKEEALKHKDKQLTTEMMYRLQQQEQFEAIRQKLLTVNRNAKKEVKEALENIIKGLEFSAEDISWKDFEIRFLNVYPDFFEKLAAINPKLTRNERRLSALLKMEFNTKEISTMTGQTEQTVVKARHRLRKKLGIDNLNITFEAFFEGF